jgi:hypothetical protein
VHQDFKQLGLCFVIHHDFSDHHIQ